jgi:hypothetical protein
MERRIISSGLAHTTPSELSPADHALRDSLTTTSEGCRALTNRCSRYAEDAKGCLFSTCMIGVGVRERCRDGGLCAQNTLFLDVNCGLSAETVRTSHGTRNGAHTAIKREFAHLCDILRSIPCGSRSASVTNAACAFTNYDDHTGEIGASKLGHTLVAHTTTNLWNSR